MPKPDIKILLDTNVLIQTEDNKQVESAFAELIQKCNQHGIPLYIHEASIEDINRDKDASRRAVTLSKAEKYPQLKGIPCPTDNELARQYGPIKKINDHVDVRLLHALSMNVVGLLVSEDIGLHERAETAGLGDRVLIVSEALGWIKQTYEPKSVFLPNVAAPECYQVDLAQDIFDSLRADYPFDDWFKDKCIPEHRRCWTVNEDKKILGIAIWKDETGKEFTSEFDGTPLAIDDHAKILKVCTYKVHDIARGSKIGEHLLKQALWHAHQNKYDWVYLTAYEDKQSYLISFLKGFGFSVVGKKKNGEILVAKPMYQGHELGEQSPLDFHKKFYPHAYDGDKAKKFVIPVEPQFHLKLFPEYTPVIQQNLFVQGVLEEVSGNAIRKVYLCRSSSNKLSVGDVVLFYMSKDENFSYSQSLTVIGVVDGITECANLEELIQVTAKRSVYSHAELAAKFAGDSRPVKTIDFFIAGHLQGPDGRPLNLNELIKAGIMKAHPQSIGELPESKYALLKKATKIVHGK